MAGVWFSGPALLKRRLSWTETEPRREKRGGRRDRKAWNPDEVLPFSRERRRKKVKVVIFGGGVIKM